MLLLSSALLTFICKINLSNQFFQEHYQSANCLDPDLDRHSVGPDLGPNCLQRLSADDKTQRRKELERVVLTS